MNRQIKFHGKADETMSDFDIVTKLSRLTKENESLKRELDEANGMRWIPVKERLPERFS